MIKQFFFLWLIICITGIAYGQEKWGIKKTNCDEKTCNYLIHLEETLTRNQGEKLSSLFLQKEGIVACQIDYVENTCEVIVEKDFPPHYLSHVIRHAGLHIRQHPGRNANSN